MHMQDLAKELGIAGPREELCLQWTDDIKQNETNSQSVALYISAQLPNARKLYMKNVHTITALKLPVPSLDLATISARGHLKDLPIAPYTAERARILISLDNLKLIIPSETRQREGDERVAARCKIVWSVVCWYSRNCTTGFKGRRSLAAHNVGYNKIPSSGETMGNWTSVEAR
ncbi:PREDICTED: uncharacterized protein LOC108381380 [Rhagoletis zephyria]|uniref:uncharacterized protein LOC108381380 n=1 Tax=Rhagoletis zephyria TaxID=28612 RepID=UPI0008114DBA|nr:PREDICTED: uncharacterized protein LOC108381380 [Rhagoletis zephyria]